MSVARGFEGEAPGEARIAALYAEYTGAPRDGAERLDRRDVDDAAAVPARAAAGMVAPCTSGRQRGSPCSSLPSRRRSVRGTPGAAPVVTDVVDEHVDPAYCLVRRRPGPAPLAADVKTTAIAPSPTQRAWCRSFRSISAKTAPTPRAEALDDPSADAVSPAGDDRDLSREQRLHEPPRYAKPIRTCVSSPTMTVGELTQER